MNLKLCLLLFFLCAIIIPAQLKKEKHDKHDERDKHGDRDKQDARDKHQHHDGRPVKHPGKRGRARLEYLKAAFDTSDDSDDDDDANEWLIELQGRRGKCSSKPCLNGGTCSERGDTYKCKCTKQFTGPRCEIGKRICKRGTCGTGLCLLTSTFPYYKCKCIPPFAPPNCKTPTPCNPNPCKNNGRCVAEEGDFECVCSEGFRGQYCKVDPNDCYEGDGQSYRGKVSETEDGDECLDWNSEFILDKGTYPSLAFASTEGLGPHNFCRNPDGDKKPWCFIKKDKKLQWEHCDVRKCPTPATTTKPPTTLKPTVPAKTEPSTTPESTSSPQRMTTILPTTVPVDDSFTRSFNTCGKPEPKKQLNRIYGGLKAIPGAHPWQVSVRVRPKGSSLGYRHICGGTLIKPCWVLTAAHCIDKKHEYSVVLGGLNLLQKELTDQTVLVEDTIVHEKFKETPEVVYNDIALLKLKATNGECAKENQFVKAACLPKEPFLDGAECSISGWGATETSEQGSLHLLDAKVLLISREACSGNKVYATLLDDGMFCAGYLKGGVDSCQGDSGGPLTCERNQTHYVYGIVSWGDSCGEKNKPGVYTRIIKYLDWINAKITGRN